MSLNCDSFARNSPDEVINGAMCIIYSMLYIIIFIMYVRIDYSPTLIDIRPRCAQRDDHTPDKPVSCNLPTFEISFVRLQYIIYIYV